MEGTKRTARGQVMEKASTIWQMKESQSKLSWHPTAAITTCKSYMQHLASDKNVLRKMVAAVMEKVIESSIWSIPKNLYCQM